MSMYMHRGLFDFVPGKAVNIIFFYSDLFRTRSTLPSVKSDPLCFVG